MTQNKKTIILSTDNVNKLKELEALISTDEFEVKTKADFELTDFAVEETGQTLEENAALKVEGLVQKLEDEGVDLSKAYVLSDDTGLFVDVLNGKPGVYSSRYAGLHASDADNVDKLLDAISAFPQEERTAHFSTVICYYHQGQLNYVEGRLDGILMNERRGSEGFGYDPIFYLPDREKTLAQLPKEEKNKISHRALAYEEFLERLHQHEN